MVHFKNTYGPIIFLLVILAIVVFAATSCESSSSKRRSQVETLQTEGLDRLMVEECGMYEIVPEKGMAIDTTIKPNRLNRHLRVYKLNQDSTRYVLCK